MRMQNEKKDSGIGYIVLIVIILVLGFKLYQSYDDARLDDVKVLDYVRDNIPFYEVCSCYDESKIKEYISDKYIPEDIWWQVRDLNTLSWEQIIDYDMEDAYGRTLVRFLDEVQKEAEHPEQEWSEDGRWLKRQQG